jgi:adenylate cyclase
MKLTLNRVFALSLIGLLAGLALLFWTVFHGLESTLLKSAQLACARDSAAIGESVTEYLSHAPGAVAKFQSLLDAGLTKPNDPGSLRDGLLSLLLHNADISEATFTFAKDRGKDASGALIIDPTSVGQVSLFRAQGGIGFVHRNIWYQGGRYFSTHAHVSNNGQEVEVEPPVEVPDPAAHSTFTSAILPRLYGTRIWSDLQYFAIDQAMEERQRRVEVSVQQAIDYPAGHFAGVLRIGLFKNAIDRAIEKPPAVDTTTHTIFLCDNDGRLVALSGSTHYVDSGNDLRLSTANAPPQVLDALKLPVLKSIDNTDSTTDQAVPDQFITSGTTYLYTFKGIPDTQGWIVGMAVPRSVYLDAFWEIRSKFFWGAIALVTVITLLGGIILYTVSAAHSVILREAALMNDFHLDPSKNSCHFSDINHVLSSLERAKTAMRSMGKYVPMDLVRRLYHRGEEPHLGGETTELTVLFTDIQSFTAFAETRDADTVAIHLGAYLEVLASVIQREKGTIDKFIGDSVMAFWNAPEPVPGYSALACRAALSGREALRMLYTSPAWDGLPAFETRFGLHKCIASVGHFGSPERFNYTAIGDGVNLASRLQDLNKFYGTTIMASAALRDDAGPGFLWRHLDRVSVKGKTQGVDIYELIGESTQPIPACVAIYEQALDAYLGGDFHRALILAETQPDDPPSVALAARCQSYLAEPPPADWDGVYSFETK